MAIQLSSSHGNLVPGSRLDNPYWLQGALTSYSSSWCCAVCTIKPNLSLKGLTVQNWLQGALSSSSTLLQLQAFARVRGPEGRQDKDLDWEVLYLALRCGHFQEAIKVLSCFCKHPSCILACQATSQAPSRYLLASASISSCHTDMSRHFQDAIKVPSCFSKPSSL